MAAHRSEFVLPAMTVAGAPEKGTFSLRFRRALPACFPLAVAACCSATCNGAGVSLSPARWPAQVALMFAFSAAHVDCQASLAAMATQQQAPCTDVGCDFAAPHRPAGRDVLDESTMPIGVPAQARSEPAAGSQFFFAILTPAAGEAGSSGGESRGTPSHISSRASSASLDAPPPATVSPRNCAGPCARRLVPASHMLARRR